jgi:hypothetical protein
MRRSSSVRISGFNNQGGSTSSFFVGGTESPHRSKEFPLSISANGSPSSRTKDSKLSTLENGTQMNRLKDVTLPIFENGSGSVKREIDLSPPFDENDVLSKLQQIPETANDEEFARQLEMAESDPDPAESVVTELSSSDPEAGKEITRRVVRLGPY